MGLTFYTEWCPTCGAVTLFERGWCLKCGEMSQSCLAEMFEGWGDGLGPDKED